MILTRTGADGSDSIFIEGEAPARQAACLVPRQYRKQPDWWVIDIVAIEAPSSIPQRFRLSIQADGLWGTEGIEVKGPTSSLRIPRRRIHWTDRFRIGGSKAVPPSGGKSLLEDD